MEIQCMKQEDVVFFRANVRRTLDHIFAGQSITTATEYFALWQEIKRVLEEELHVLVNHECDVEVKKIRGE